MSKPREIIIAGNWKMNHGPRAAAAFHAELAPLLAGSPRASGAGLRAILFVPSVSLAAARDAAAAHRVDVEIGSQVTHGEKSGAFTGEISGPMLQELQIPWTLVGHSERRQHFGETDESARKRMESLLEQGLRVMLCIGETRAEREAGQTAATLERQLRGAIPSPGQGAARFLDGRLVIAYEPVWAIGTGLTATPDQAEQAHQLVRKQLWDRFGLEAAGKTQILYGGSVTPQNIDALLSCPNVDGALVGGASVKADSFAQLVLAGARSASAP